MKGGERMLDVLDILDILLADIWFANAGVNQKKGEWRGMFQIVLAALAGAAAAVGVLAGVEAGLDYSEKE